jgi:hypothetical protein
LTPSWSSIDGKLRQVDISPSNVVWGTNSGHLIWLRIGTAWIQIGGRLKHVTAGNAGVWGVNSGDQIFYRERVTPSNLKGTSWTKVAGKKVFVRDISNYVHC